MANMTAKQLIDILTAFEPDTEVIMQVEAFDWRTVDRVLPPYSESRLTQAICLVSGEAI